MSVPPYRHILSALRRNHFQDGQADTGLQLLCQAFATTWSNAGNGPTYPRAANEPSILDSTSWAIPESCSTSPGDVLDDLPAWLGGALKGSHERCFKNIIPAPSLIGVAVYAAASSLMANGVSGEDGGNIVSAELACVHALGELIGWDPRRSGGCFTFGGTGTNMYAVRIGICNADPQSRKEGISQRICVLGSRAAHYSHETACGWLGLGEDNYIKVASKENQTTDLGALEKEAAMALRDGRRIACIMAAGGTTSNCAVDDVQAIVDVRDRLVVDYGLSYRPHVHVDSVTGWVFQVFDKYDFDVNRLGIPEPVLEKISRTLGRSRTMRFADSAGVDFHKTGFLPYTSSLFLVRRRDDFGHLRRGDGAAAPLFHDPRSYNPGLFTLETSRPSATFVATWLTLRAFGLDGYRTLLAHAVEMGLECANRMQRYESQGFDVLNRDSFGPDVFLRCYPANRNVGHERTNESADKDRFHANNRYLDAFVAFYASHRDDGAKEFLVSKSRAACFREDGTAVPAMRVYPLSPYIDATTIDQLATSLARAKAVFDSAMESELGFIARGAAGQSPA